MAYNKYLLRSIMIAISLLAPAVLQAQAYQCNVPASLPRPRVEGPTQREPRRVLPIGGYTLALIWTPEACNGPSPNVDANFTCGRGNRFGFTLHGLWPDGKGKDWPQYCATAAPLPEPVIRRNLCATPSAQLMQHEYVKHGTCMGVSPDAYFRRSTGLYAKLRYPDMAALSARRTLTAGQFAAAFARANPGITAEMIRLNVNRRGWLEEVWLCLDTRLRYQRCPAHQGGPSPGAAIRIQRPMRG